MTQPQDPRKHPLQDDELALARVLRALPGTEPPAHLDAAILRAATDAAATEAAAASRPRKAVPGLRWLPTWAIGSAAAAVLAVGVGLQLRPPLAVPLEPQATVGDAKRNLPQAQPRMSVDLAEPERTLAPVPAPPPAQQGVARRAPPAPPPPPPVIRDAAPATPAAAAPAPAMAAAPPVEEVGAFAPPPEAFPETEAADEAATLDSIVVSGSRIRVEPEPDAAGAGAARDDALARRQQSRAAASEQRESRKAEAPAPALPPVADDARLAPREWIERIRDRRNQGDRAGARASLMLYLSTYPKAPVPTDLAPLR